MQSAKNILERIKEAYKIKQDKDLANFLGCSPSTLSTWKKRDSIDYQLIFAKCKDINFNWLIKGEGDIFRENIDEDLEKIIKTIKENPTAKKMVLRLIE